jgi:predicted dehydrogenase
MAVRDAARHADAFCAIPFVWRYSDLVRNFRARVSPADIIHLAFRFVAGPPSRYKEFSPWMLHKATAGGGCMTNLGVHFIDLALLLTASESAEVLAAAFHYVAGNDVEDYATALLSLSSGASLAVETGYAYPMDEAGKRDNRWNIVSRKGYYTLDVGFFEAREFGHPTVLRDMDTDSDVYYATFAAQTLGEYATGLAPTCGLDDMVKTRSVLDAIMAEASQ